MSNFFNILAIQELEGGTYTVETILQAIKQVTDYAIAIGLSLGGLAVVISCVIYSIVDVEQKQRTRTRIVQTLVGIGGIILSLSLVNIIIRIFAKV